MHIINLSVNYSFFQVVEVKSLTVLVLTFIFSNDDTLRLAEIMLVSIDLRSNLCSGWLTHYILRRHT